MTSDSSDSTVSGVQKMPSKKAYWIIAEHLFIASAKSSFMIGLVLSVWMCFGMGSINIAHLIGAFCMCLWAVLVGLFSSFPLVFISAAICTFLKKYKVAGLLPLIIKATLTAVLYGQIILLIFKMDKITLGFFIFNTLFPIGGFLTALFAYPKIKTIELE